jgi:hypothetical protein
MWCTVYKVFFKARGLLSPFFCNEDNMGICFKTYSVVVERRVYEKFETALMDSHAKFLWN